ncbi:MAG TPA: hypothetical protein VMG12_40350 [Polyangiaceae bacterium]|nr:hypothetical protein [Polyangiaceae bacterium]
MLNARTLAQATTDEPSSDTADPLRPVEAIQTKGGVIVLSNRPAEGEAATPAPERAAPAPAPPPAAPAPPPPPIVSVAPTALPRETSALDTIGTGVWLAAAAFVIALALIAGWLMRRKRRLTTARYAALLAGSEPIAPPEHVGPFAPKPGAPSSSAVAAAVVSSPPGSGSPATRTPSPATRTPSPASATRTPFPSSSPTATPFPRSANDDRAPPSGISAPPVSERQWLSQPPPRSYKEPPS